MGRRKGDRTHGRYVANPRVWQCEDVFLEDELYADDRYEWFREKLLLPDEEKVASWVEDTYYAHANGMGLRWLATMTKTDYSRLSRWFKGEWSIQYNDVLKLIKFCNSLIREPEHRRPMFTSDEEIRDILKHMKLHNFRYVNPSYVTWRHDWSEESYWKWYRGEAERGLTYRKMKGYLDTVLFEYEAVKYVYDHGKRYEAMIIA